MGTARCRIYKGDALAVDGAPTAQLAAALHEPGTVAWVDLLDPTEAELCTLADELGLHELAVEDALKAHQRPKLDRYADHLFLACHAAYLDQDAGELRVTEVAAFVGERWMLTVRRGDGTALDIDEIATRLDRLPHLADHGVSFLLYGLLDVVVDSYFGCIDAFDDYYDRVADEIFAEHPIPPDQQQHWFQMRRALFKLHRIAMPARETVASVMHREHGLVEGEISPYFQDVYDHIIRVTESTEALRDLVATIVETNLSLRDYRQNVVMKKVTSWAAIVAVPTLITGYYGMNVPYPGFAEDSGVWIATLLVLVLPVLLYLQFKRRDWL